MADSDTRPKRSRFDQTEPEPPKRTSRFDRRSLSPTSRRSEPRERSPWNDKEGANNGVDPAAAAAAAAAKINASLQARRGIQHVEVPPIKNSDGTTTPASDGPIREEVYVADGDYIKDIEINDYKTRFLVTKGSVQAQIKEETGADITTRGNYLPDKSMASATKPPLYLHVTSTTKEGLEKAVAKIEDMLKQDLPNLVDERRFRRREPQEQVERDEFGRRKWPEAKISITLDPLPGFNLRAQVVGQGGQYVKHIQNETGCRVQIKGRGSGYLEQATNQEADEEMFLHVAGPDPVKVEEAKSLCEDLVASVKQQYEDFKSRPPRHRGFDEDRRGGGGGGGDSYRGGREGDSYGGRGYGGGDRGGGRFRDRGGDRSDRGDRGSDRDRDHYRDGPRERGDRGDSYRGGGDSHRGGYENSYRPGDSRPSHDSSAAAAPQAHAASVSAAASMDPAASAQANADYAAQYAQYYGGQDPYAAYGGYTAYMQWYYAAAAAAQQQQQPGTPSGGAPPPPPSDSAPPPPPLSSTAAPPLPGAPGAGGSYGSAPPPPPGL